MNDRPPRNIMYEHRHNFPRNFMYEHRHNFRGFGVIIGALRDGEEVVPVPKTIVPNIPNLTILD